MKSKFIISFTLLLLISGICKSQDRITNAFYLAKSLSKLQAPLNDSLTKKILDEKIFSQNSFIVSFIKNPTNKLNDNLSQIDKEINYDKVANLLNKIRFTFNNISLDIDSLKKSIIYYETQIKKYENDSISPLATSINNSLRVKREETETFPIKQKSLDYIEFKLNNRINEFSDTLEVKLDSILKYCKDSINSIFEGVTKKNNLEKTMLELRLVKEKTSKNFAELKTALNDGNLNLGGTEFKKFDKNTYAINLSRTTASYIVLESSVQEKDLAKSSFKIPSESEAIDALAIFMANRFKEELTLTFIDGLKDILDKQPTIKQLFPKTKEVLDGTKEYKLPDLGNTLAQAFATDLLSIDKHLSELKIISPEIVENLKNTYELIKALEKGQRFEDVIDLLDNTWSRNEISSSVFGQVVHGLRLLNDNFRSYDGENYYMKFEDLNEMTDLEMEYFVTILSAHDALISKILNKKEILSKNGDINQLKLRELKNDIANLLLTLNRFEEVLKNGNGKDGKERNLEIGQNLIILFKEVTDFFMLNDSTTDDVIRVTEDMLQIYKYKMQSEYRPMIPYVIDILKTSMNYVPGSYNFSSGFLRDFSSLYEIASKVVNDTIITQQEFNTLKSVSKILSKNLFKDFEWELLIIDSNYTPSFLNVVNSNYQTIKDLHTFVPKIEKFLSSKPKDFASFKAEFIESLIRFQDSIKNFYNLNENSAHILNDSLNAFIQTFLLKDNDFSVFLEKLSVIGRFATDVLSAKDSKKLSEVITSYAAPVNSYKVKRNTRSSFSINGFVGGFVGWESKLENLGSIEKIKKASYITNVGLTVPLGLTYSIGFRRNLSSAKNINPNSLFINWRDKQKTLTGGAISFTATFIDIAAPFIYRFTNGDDEGLPQEIKFEQVFSPGLIVSIHHWKLPWCLNAGAQVAPKLRTIEGKSNPADILRYHIGIAFDIPLLQVWTNTRFSNKD